MLLSKDVHSVTLLSPSNVEPVGTQLRRKQKPVPSVKALNTRRFFSISSFYQPTFCGRATRYIFHAN
jgi:hypothetical protein